MFQRMVKVVLLAALCVAVSADTSWARGPGGRGGRSGGASRGGNVGQGAFGGGNDANRDQKNLGQNGGQNFGGQNFRGQSSGQFSGGAAKNFGQSGNFGAAPNRDQVNQFFGLPSNNASGAQGAAATSAYSNRNGSQFSGAEGAAAGSAYSNRNGSQFSGAQGAAASSAFTNRNAPQYSGAEGAAAGAAVSNRNDPQFSGAEGAAAGAAYSNRNAPQFSGAQGAALGYAAATPQSRNTNAAAVRGSFNNYNVYGAGWYNDHPNAWQAAALPGGPWAAATWNSLNRWIPVAAAQPVYYDYGNTVTYVDDSVYVSGEEVGTSTEYYQQAEDLATSGAAADAPSDGEWMSLGVFSLSPNNQPSSNHVVQLSVNKQGVVRGNYTDSTTNETQPVRGAVDLKTQRVAFTIGDDSSTVFETGLYNLTKDQAPALLHHGQDSTEQWLLVRLSQPSK